VFLLEAYHTVYLWLGWWPGASEGESPPPVTGTALSRWLQDKQLGMKTAETYARAISRRCQTYVVVAGFEPDRFKNVFPTWQTQKGIQNHAAHACKNTDSLLLVEDELKKFYRKFSIEELRLRPLPEDIDPIRLETYLTDVDFQTVFKLTRDQFYQLPQWKQVDAKKAAGLF
jgi:supervillin